jgi:xanthine dehydrogenase accessory factor
MASNGSSRGKRGTASVGGMHAGEAELLVEAENWREAGRRVAMATVVETFGSAPRPVGSRLIIDDAGVFLGSISGGCVEGDVVTSALDVIEDGRPRLLEFGVAEETAWRAGLSCGGRIAVYVERIDSVEMLRALIRERAARRLCVMIEPLDGGEPRLVSEESSRTDPLILAARGRLGAGVSGVLIYGGRRYFIDVRNPSLRLILVGAVHVAQALALMAELADFEVHIVDPRTAFAAEERFPDRRLIAEWPDVALPALGLDAYTAVATLTHDPKIDDRALRCALTSECFYVGALGSKKTHARRVARLIASGLEPATIARLHAPIGLDIGAATPGEIAVAVLSEIILALRRGATEQSAGAAEARRPTALSA